MRFGGLVAVDDVSFDVHPGELLGLIGPNGAGKTTMMRAIMGIVRPAKGSVMLDGRSASTRCRSTRASAPGWRLSQQLVKPFREIDVHGQRGACRRRAQDRARRCARCLSCGPPGRARTSRAKSWAASGIAKHADQSPRTQPLGVLKRLEMARALALKPKLLLLDEPLAGLNTNEANALGADHRARSTGRA